MSRPPDPGPTRLADPNQSPGRDTIYTIYILCCTGTLINPFFLRVVPVPVSIQTISVITKIIYIYQKNYHRSGVHKNLYTYTESIFLYMYNFYIRDLRKQRWEHLSLSRPALLMWNVMSSILVFCCCTYTD